VLGSYGLSIILLQTRCDCGTLTGKCDCYSPWYICGVIAVDIGMTVVQVGYDSGVTVMGFCMMQMHVW